MIENIRLNLNQTEQEQLLEIIGSANKIVITSHQNPDGDAVGSLLGLYHILNNQKKNCICVLPDNFSSFLSWMPGSDKIIFHDSNKVNAKHEILTCDVLFALDYNGASRVGKDMSESILATSAKKIMIDHHPNPENFCDYTISVPSECSTAQMIYRFAATLGYAKFISKEAASCLYSGIMTDTGSFRFPATTALTHYIVAQLIEHGAVNWQIHNLVYDTNTENRLRLLGYALSTKLVVLPQHKTAYISLTKNELEKFNHRKGDTEGFVNYALSIDGIMFAAIFMETDEQIKLSFRSKENIPVNEFMSTHFMGGGHKNAAGGRWNDTLDVTIQRFVSLIPDFMKQHG